MTTHNIRFENKLHIHGRTSQVPEKNFPKHGYGINLFKGIDTKLEGVVSANRFLSLIESGALNASPEINILDLKIVGGMFNLAQAAHKADWFYQSFNLGHPSHLLARKIVEKIVELQVAIVQEDEAGMKDICRFLKDAAAPEMINNYLDLARGGKPTVESGWAYISWSSDRKHKYQIGASHGTMQEILQDVCDASVQNSRNYGVLAAWLIHDPDAAFDTIRRALAPYEHRKGGYLAQPLKLDKASGIIEAELIASDNLVLSPWHVDDDMIWELLDIDRSAMTESVGTSSKTNVSDSPAP